MAAAATRNYVYPFTTAETTTHIAGLVVCGIAFGISEYIEAAKLHSDWFLKLLRDHGADFAWEGFFTFGAMLALGLLCWFVGAESAGANFCLWSSVTFATLGTVTFGYLYEWTEFCARSRHGDWGDVFFETMGWICTMVPVLIVHRRRLLP